MVRTRLMNQPPDAKVYSGFIDCVIKITAKEGTTNISLMTTSFPRCESLVLRRVFKSHKVLPSYIIIIFNYLHSLVPYTVIHALSYHAMSYHVVMSIGPGGLYAGFIPIWARFAPTTCLQVHKYPFLITFLALIFAHFRYSHCFAFSKYLI